MNNHFKYVYKSSFQVFNHFYRDKKVVMLHPARCGSTVIARMLNNHSKIFWGGELFNSISISGSEIDKLKAIKCEINRNANRRVSRIYGFETKYLPYQALATNRLNLQISEFLKHLEKLGFDKFILLQRRNYLRRVISVEIGLRTKKWHIKNKKEKPDKILLDVKRIHTADKITSLLELFRVIDESYWQAQNYLHNNEMLPLAYEEDILPSPVIAYKKVCDFLDIPEESKKIELNKTNPFEVKEMLLNFDEVEKELLNTRYEWMLYE